MSSLLLRSHGRLRGAERSAFAAAALALLVASAPAQPQADAQDPPPGSAADTTAVETAPATDVGPPPVIATTTSMDPAVVALLGELVAEVEKDPKSADARAELGLAYEGNTIWTYAETCYDQALQLAPDATEWLFRRGVVRLKNGDLDGAIEDMRGTAAVYKNTPVVQARLGSALRMAGELEAAEAAWRMAITAEQKQTPPIRYAASRVGLAAVLVDRERPEEAETLCREALELAPGYRPAHYTLGLALLDQGRVEEGEMELAAGENAFPGFPPGPHDQRLQGYGRGFSRRMMIIENLVSGGNLAEAKTRLDEILEGRGDDHLVLNLAARVAMRSGDMETAKGLLARSREVSPGEPATLIESCLLELELANRVAMQLGQMQQAAQMGQQIDQAQFAKMQSEGAASAQRALEFATQAAQAAPIVGRNHYWLAVSHQTTATFATDQQAQGQSLQAALGAFQTAQRLGCTEPQFNQQLASLYGQMGRGREMLRFALRHLDANPTDTNALALVVQAHVANQQPEAILPYVQRLEKAAAGNVQMLQFAIQGYLTVDAFDAAEAALGKFEAAAAGNPQAAQFVTAVQEFIRKGRAEKAPAPTDGDGSDPSGGGGRP